MNLISCQRLLQRRMKSASDQTTYIRFVTEGERLDAFMREQQQQEELFGVTSQQVSVLRKLFVIYCYSTKKGALLVTTVPPEILYK